MSDDGRRSRYWMAHSSRRPQYRVQVLALPRPGGAWLVRLMPLADVTEGYDCLCATGWEAAQEVWEVLASLDVLEDWSAFGG